MAQTITYAYPVAGTTPPTLAQALLCNMVTATVFWSDSEVTALLTHNWGLTAAQSANLWPVVIIEYDTGSLTTLPQAITVNLSSSTNVVTLNKSTVVGGNGTLLVTLLRPFSEIT
jgi:hypothetical protein